MRDTLNDMSTDLFLEYKKIGADESGLDIVIQAQQKGYVALERNCEEPRISGLRIKQQVKIQ